MREEFGNTVEWDPENLPSIRRQNSAIFELFSDLPNAEKLDRERVLGY
jgi:hypothetical protein